MSPSVRLVLYKTTLTGEDSGSSRIQSLIGDSAGKLTNYKGFLPADVYNVFFTGQWWWGWPWGYQNTEVFALALMTCKHYKHSGSFEAICFPLPIPWTNMAELAFSCAIDYWQNKSKVGSKQEAYTLKPDGLPCQTTLLHARAARAQTFRSHKQPQELVVAKESGVMWQTCWQTIQGTILSWLGKIIWGRITYCGKTIYGLHKGSKTPVEFCPFVRSGLRHGNIWKDRNLM